MPKENSYLVPSEVVRVKQEIKKSRFITTVARAINKEEAKDFIKKVSAEHPNASHNCYAFIAGNPNSSTDIGMGDDGEVPGTAGKPMLNILRHKQIGEIAVVVTRYFGGIKLGPGGLGRVYTSSLQLALDKLKLERHVVIRPLTIITEYKFENSIRQVLKRMKIDTFEVEYKDDLFLHIEVPENMADNIQEQVMNQTHGQAQINWHNEL